jgi:hypothetical protein
MNWIKKMLGGKAAAAAPKTVATMRQEAGDLYVLRIGGILNKATLDNIQAVAKQGIAAGAKSLKVLLILDDFHGWKRGDDWGDLDFFVQYEQYIGKIAVVGDPGWKMETEVFLAAGRRTGEVRYFLSGQEAKARAWLEERSRPE